MIFLAGLFPEEDLDDKGLDDEYLDPDDAEGDVMPYVPPDGNREKKAMLQGYVTMTRFENPVAVQTDEVFPREPANEFPEKH